MHFGFALDSLDIDSWNVDLSDTHLDLLDTDVLYRPSVCLQDVLKNFFSIIIMIIFDKLTIRH